MLIIIGLVLLAVGAIWWERNRRRRRSRVAAGLVSTDPAVRAQALREVSSVGLRPWAPLLLSRIQEVDDEALLGELVWVIAACQWEPADDPSIVQLRLWARQRSGSDLTALAEAAMVPNPPATPMSPAVTSTPAPQPLTPPAVPEASTVLSSPTSVVVTAPQAALGAAQVAEPAARPSPAPASPSGPKPALVNAIEDALGRPVLAVEFVPAPRRPQPAPHPDPESGGSANGQFDRVGAVPPSRVADLDAG